jgi:magnesium-transporting ATPase (P-type)
VRIHQLSPSDAIASLNSSPAGLTHAEAGRRLREFGRNAVEEAARVPPWLRLIKEFTTFFSLILWVAAGLAFFAEWSAPGQGMAKIGYAIVAVILVSGVFSFWQEFRVEQTLAALRKLLPQQVAVLREDKVTRMLAEQLVPGDIVVLQQGDSIPADCRLIEAFGVRLDNAAITGEALPKARDTAPSGVDELIRSKNIVLAGTAMVSGQAKAVVFATGMHTEFGKIAHLSQTAGDAVSPLRREITHLSRLTAIIAVVIGLTFFAVGSAIGISFLCRSSTRSVFSTGLFGNPLIICGVITEIALLLLINYTPWGNALLGTAGIEKQVWLFVIPFGAGVLILEELRKWIARRTLRIPAS